LLEIKDSVAVIAGGAGGIGLTLTKSWVKNGGKVVVADVAEGLLRSAEIETKALNGEVVTMVCDVTKEEDNSRLADLAIEKFGRRNLMAPLAGIIRDGMMVSPDKESGKVTRKLSLADFRLVVDINLTGVFLTVRECAQRMINHDCKGLICLISSTWSLGNVRFRDLAYATKTLPSGNSVIDDRLMSWVYRLKSIEREAPLFTYFRDINLFEFMVRTGVNGVGKTAVAINHWLIYDRNDLPVNITKMSFDSYTIPISSKGPLPVKLFGRELYFDFIREKGIHFQIYYAAKDDLVDPASALAPMDYVQVELAEFPKGHAAIATSWSDPDSEYALHKIFENNQSGPVRFHLDLDRSLV
jgi:NAD(P)-dependent dehydrogenase (short-subunit alcohol dehydrogenase family)